MTSITKDTYQVDFAPDGKHWQKVKCGKIEKLWNDFCFNVDYKVQCALNPSAKFRLININTQKVIGTLPN